MMANFDAYSMTRIVDKQRRKSLLGDYKRMMIAEYSIYQSSSPALTVSK